MSQGVRDCDTFPSPYPSSSMDDSFQILSRESAELSDNDTTASSSQRNHISLTEQDDSAPCELDEMAGESSEVRSGDSGEQSDITPPVPKRRTLLLHTLPPQPPPTESVSPSAPTDTPRTRTPSTSSTERRVPGTPPIPRPRIQSGGRRDKEVQVGKDMKQTLDDLSASLSRVLLLEEQLNEADKEISDLKTRNSDLELQVQPVVDVEESLRLKDVDLQLAREASLRLQESVKAKESALKEKESQLHRTESRVLGLQEEVKTLQQPNDPKKRLEVRLSEAIGKRKEVESELDRLTRERDEFEREREEYRVELEGLGQQKRELESEGERERREWETERGGYTKSLSQLQAEKSRLEEEKLHLEGEEMKQLQKERDDLHHEVERLKESLKRAREELEQEQEKNRVAKEDMEKTTNDFQEQLKRQLQDSEQLRQQLVTQHQTQCGSLQERLGEVEKERDRLKLELTTSTTKHEATSEALKTEQSTTKNLQQDCDELKRTCEDYTVEINSLLADLEEHATTIRTVEGERDTLQQQNDGLRRKFAENQEQWKKTGEELTRVQEREKRLLAQRDGLQNREEIMDLQLKQYMSDFEEERAAREKMAKVVKHLEARERDASAQIAQLRRQVNDLSTEKNDLVFQNEQQRLQLQQLQQQ